MALEKFYTRFNPRSRGITKTHRMCIEKAYIPASPKSPTQSKRASPSKRLARSSFTKVARSHVTHSLTSHPTPATHQAQTSKANHVTYLQRPKQQLVSATGRAFPLPIHRSTTRVRRLRSAAALARCPTTIAPPTCPKLLCPSVSIDVLSSARNHAVRHVYVDGK